MQFLDTPRFDLTSVAPGDVPGDDDPYEKRIALARELEGVDLVNPYKAAGDPGHLYELKEAFRKQTDEIAARHPGRAKEIALPEFSTAGEIFRSSTETEDLTHSFIGKGLSIERAYDERIKTIKQLTGKDLPNPVSQAGDPGHYYELKEEFNRLAEELAEQNPELRNRIQPLSSISREAGRIREKSERHAEDVWEKSEKDAAAWIARIGGGFYSFLHDPVQIATSAAAPFKAAGAGVKGLLWMGLKQGAANAGAEAVMQPFVQQWRKEANMDYGAGRAAADIGMAGAFGFALDAGVRSAVRGARQVAGRPYLGPDEPPAPATPPGGPESTGARLPGLPEGRTAEAAPAPRAYRGADPIPPMEALEQAARNAPEGSVLRRAAEGDEDALLQLAKETGQDGDPAIKRIIAELETERVFKDVAPLNVDGGEHYEWLSRQVRHESGAADLPVGDAIVAPVRREIASLADEVEGIATRIEDKPVGFRAIDPAQVATDASTFQFKSGGDLAGVTDRLRGVTRWDPVSAGKAIVFERADGSMVIADGHQRLGLAKRATAEGQDAKLDAYVFREADGWTPEDVRAYAALKNMRESSGTSIDMAQVMRDRPDLIDGSLPLTDAKLKEAAMLARLSPEAFDAAVAGRLPPPFAALIGESVADASRHRGLLDEMADAGLQNTSQARAFLKQAMERPAPVEVQQAVLGGDASRPALTIDADETLHAGLLMLRKDKRILGLLARETGQLEAATMPVRDVNKAQSIERLMAHNADRLAEIEGRIKTVVKSAQSVEIDIGKLRRMNEKAVKLRSGMDDRTEFRKKVDSLLFFGDPQEIRNLRAERLEGRRDETLRTARQLQQDYDLLARQADGILDDLEILRGKRDEALGLGAPAAATALPAPEARKARAQEAKQIGVDRANQLADLIETLATSRGPVAAILNESAASVARGVDPKLASRAFVDRIADTLEKEGIPGLVKVDEAPKPELAPVRMDDPLGPEAKAQADDVNWALELDDEIMFAMRGQGLRAKTYAAPEATTTDDITTALKSIRDTVADAQTAPLTGRFAPADLQQRFIAYKQADTDLRAALIGGLDPEDAVARYASLKADAERLVNDMRRVDARINRDIEKDIKAKQGKGGEEEMFARNATLHNTTLSTRAADEMASIRAGIDSAVAKSLPAGWRAEVRQSLVFGDLSERIRKRNPGVPPDLAIEGTFDPYERIIYVSMAALDPVERAFEEAGHALKAMRLVPEADYGILAAKAKEIGAREKFRIDERYGDVYGARWKDDPARLEEALEEEAIMQMVAARARGDDFGKQSNAILDKLVKFLRAIRDMLGLKGFRTFEDVFEDMTEGGFARAMDAQRGGAGSGRTVGGEVMAAGPGKTAADAAGASITQTPEFRKWFGGSKVVDAEGEPRTLYHGTPAGDIEAFRTQYAGRLDSGFIGEGHYFTTKPTVADYYAQTRGGEAQTVYPVYASIKNPFMWGAKTQGARGLVMRGERLPDAIHDEVIRRTGFVFDRTAEPDFAAEQDISRAISDVLRERGHDGVVSDVGDGHLEVVAFRPEQIKSVFNRGTFDPTDPRISFSIRDPESPTATDASFIARAQAASEIMFALGDEGKGKTPEGKSPEKSPEASGEAKPAPERAAGAPSPAKASAVQLPGGRESKRIRNLINQAAAEGRFPRKDAEDVLKRMDELESFHKDHGKAMGQFAKELSAEAEERRRKRDLAELARRQNVVPALTGFRDARGQADPAKAQIGLIENLGQHELPGGMISVANHRDGIMGIALSRLDALLTEFGKPTLQAMMSSGLATGVADLGRGLAGMTRNKARMTNVVRELFGEKTGDEMASVFGQAVAQVMEELRLRFNAAGGAIAKRQNWGLPQWHNQAAIIRGGKQVWVEFVRPLLDQKWMKHPLTGDDMMPSDVTKTLEDIYDNIAADGWHEKEAVMGMRGLAAIANTRGDPRSLIFANADAWMKYSERFGGGPDALGIIVGHISSMSRDIAAMEVLGPNPAAMLKYIQDFVTQQAALRAAGRTAVFPTHKEIIGTKYSDPASYARSMNLQAENMWNIYNGRASAPVNVKFADVSQSVRSINVATKLGGAIVSALADPFWQVAARKFAGLPWTKTFSDVLMQIKPGAEREARQSGIISETFLHMHTEGVREAGAWSMLGVSNYLADRVMSLSMLGTMTRAGNHAMGMRIQAHLGGLTGKSFGELAGPVQRLLRRYGLDASDWDALRLDGGQPRDVDFLSPADLRQSLVASGGDPRLAERYLALILMESQYATATGTIRAQAVMRFGTRSGTAGGEFIRHLGQFKGFAVNLAILQIQRMAREFVSQGLSRGAQYAAFALISATLGGAMVLQLQQMRNTKDPRNMDASTIEGFKFWMNALYQSGGLSIYGDLLYAAEARQGGGIAGVVAGPTFGGTLPDLINLTVSPVSQQVRRLVGSDEKTNYGRELSRFIRRYTPGTSIAYVRAAWDRVLMDNLQRMLDPEAEASFRRLKQKQKKDYKQDYWWEPGQTFPKRGPRLGAALGAQ